MLATLFDIEGAFNDVLLYWCHRNRCRFVEIKFFFSIPTQINFEKENKQYNYSLIAVMIKNVCDAFHQFKHK